MLNKRINNFVELAFGEGTFVKAVKTAVVVGTLLILINHGDGIIQGNLPDAWKITLTFFVPFCVTTWGAIIGKSSTRKN